MSTTPSRHHLEPQQHASQCALSAPGVDLAGIAARFHHQAAKAATIGSPTLSVTLHGFGRLAAALAEAGSEDRWDVADPGAAVPAALLAPDGRYACDGCEGLVERAELSPLAHGFFCAHCALEQAA